ncbi:MAG TPA: phosphopentomutase [Bacillota bacterium]|nr:phosphopentomutase [Bacillota bacterium]HQA64727.1 phosphopentomutase [Bacillota bacterium]HQO42280.1 phosphopentomutase [Bacillota bacterium]HQQ44068.1 phosphopentomutase [Bacillota bacterium]
MVSRVILIVLDSVGIGELPDADMYGDSGSNTLGCLVRNVKDFKLKNLEALGLGNIDRSIGLQIAENPTGSFGRAKEVSPGKDTTTGHWEIAGVTLSRPFPTFPEGFPKELVEAFERAIGVKTLGNEAASGTEIIARLGDKHVETGYPIIYTSADSVFQIAAHEEVIPFQKLYEICEKARALLKDEYAVGRVIARPFLGKSGSYKRTSNRRDFSLKPIKKTMLDIIVENGMNVAAVGKIEDIFAGEGISEAVHTKDNTDVVDKTLEYMSEDKTGLIFSNLVDFDMLYGHRNDAEGYAGALMAFDERLPEIFAAMKDSDVLIITADHGCDPTTDSTDHSREYIPILVYGRHVRQGTDIGTREGFSDIGATVLDLLGLPIEIDGKSFKTEIYKI